MEEIVVIGHKNPDTDSVCSAYCYAALKNRIDEKSHYIPLSCGTLNKQTSYIFKSIGVTPPKLSKDICHIVKEVMTNKVIYSYENESIFSTIRNLEKLKIRLVPVVDNSLKFKGIISILELSTFLISGSATKKPTYTIRPASFDKVIDGEFINISHKEELNIFMMVGAMPFEKFIEYTREKDPDKILLLVGYRKDIINYAIKKQFACVVLTGISDLQNIDIDFSEFKGWIYLSKHDSAETLRLLTLCTPSKYIMNSNVPFLKGEDYLDKASDLMMKSDHRGLPVLDDKYRLIGIITRSDILKRKNKKVILVDHNEISQAIEGLEPENIVEIIDHHRLGSLRTKSPIHIYAKPVGSTCTIIYGLYKTYSVNIDNKVAALLLSGILSDTIILKSPTTTIEDEAAVKELSKIAGLNYNEWGLKIFESSSTLKTKDFKSIVTSDFKIYKERGYSVGIGQVEVTNLDEAREIKTSLLKSLDQVKIDKYLDWVMIMVTDILKGDSILLTTKFPKGESLLLYQEIAKYEYYLKDILSRKKQLLPEILNILESISK